MTAQDIPLSQMTVSEKLQIMEAIWDDLSRQNAIDSPDWHFEVLREREADYAAGRAVAVDWEIAKIDLRKNLP